MNPRLIHELIRISNSAANFSHRKQKTLCSAVRKRGYPQSQSTVFGRELLTQPGRPRSATCGDTVPQYTFTPNAVIKVLMRLFIAAA
jgi:hypothetical protein